MSNVATGVTLVDRSGTIASGGTAQEVCAANSKRSYLLLQNVSGADLWINFDATAVAAQPSMLLASGAGLVFDSKVPLGAISVYGASGAQAYVCKEG